MPTFWNHIAKRYCVVLFVSVLIISFSPPSASAPTTPQPSENITISVPTGTRNHGNRKLLCTPSKWTDIATFFLANFVSHAATVKSVPGEPAVLAILRVTFALLLPASGIYKALEAIYQHAVFADTPLKTATRARALCMVVRTSKWQPQTDDVVDCLGWRITDELKAATMNDQGFDYLDSEHTRVIDGWWWRWRHEDYAVSPNPGNLMKVVNFPKRCIDDLYVLCKGSVKKEYSRIPALVVKTLDTEYAGILRNAYFAPSRSILDTRGRKVHGVCQLPEGYALSIVSPGTQILPIGDPPDEDDDRADEEYQDTQNDQPNDDHQGYNQDQDGIRQRDGVEDQCGDPDQGGVESQGGIIDEGSDKVQGNDEDRQGDDNAQTNEKAQVDKDDGCESGFTSVRKRYFRHFTEEWRRRGQRHNFSTQDPTSHIGELSSSYNFPKSLIAIFQTLYVSATLYRVRGDQIQRYGYTAFGLTVALCLIMSIVDLLSNLLTPDYPTLYMVSSDAMDEALRRDGARFEGIVGTIQKPKTTRIPHGNIKFKLKDDGTMGFSFDTASTNLTSSISIFANNVDVWKSQLRTPIERPALMIPSCSEYGYAHQDAKQTFEYLCTLSASALVPTISIAIIGALSQFQPGHSTHAQRVWTMTWLACSIVFGPQTAAVMNSDNLSAIEKLERISYGAASIGGFVVVGRMIKEYGHCIRLY